MQVGAQALAAFPSCALMQHQGPLAAPHLAALQVPERQRRSCERQQRCRVAGLQRKQLPVRVLRLQLRKSSAGRMESLQAHHCAVPAACTHRTCSSGQQARVLVCRALQRAFCLQRTTALPGSHVPARTLSRWRARAWCSASAVIIPTSRSLAAATAASSPPPLAVAGGAAPLVLASGPPPVAPRRRASSARCASIAARCAGSNSAASSPAAASLARSASLLHIGVAGHACTHSRRMRVCRMAAAQLAGSYNARGRPRWCARLSLER